MINVVASNIVTAFDEMTVGTKVIDKVAFNLLARSSVARHDFSLDRVPGQGLVQCNEAIAFVSGGVGPRSDNQFDYLIRRYRGEHMLFLRRHNAALVESIDLVVYTERAYLSDPDVTDLERYRIKSLEASHVLIAILASCGGQKSVLSYDRFVKNLAGGNKEALGWTADEIRSKAKEVAEYNSKWCVVSD
jgi:hypothetical protein